MPVYNYKCSCGKEFESFNTIENREIAFCDCGNKATKILSPISKPVVMEYFSENLNAWITGPKQKQRIMKERNVTEAA